MVKNWIVTFCIVPFRVKKLLHSALKRATFGVKKFVHLTSNCYIVGRNRMHTFILNEVETPWRDSLKAMPGETIKRESYRSAKCSDANWSPMVSKLNKITKSWNIPIWILAILVFFYRLLDDSQFLFDFLSVPQNNIDVKQGQKSVVKEAKIMDERMKTCYVCYPRCEHSVSIRSKPF